MTNIIPALTAFGLLASPEALRRAQGDVART